jgi:late-transcription coactivator
MKNTALKESLTEIINPENDFINEVEAMVRAGSGYLDAILHWCFLKNIEQEQIISLIKNNPQFRNKITKEASELNFLKKRKPRRRKS